MDRTRFQTPPRWWSPKLSPTWVRIARPLRRRIRLRRQRLREVEVRGTEHVEKALTRQHGILITPNHSGHADALILYEAADRLGLPFYFMTAWQVLGLNNIVRRTIFRLHGCFSVDREGTDLRAFKQAVEILAKRRHPLVIFPEGEVYHLNERVTPFRDGAAAIAISAARRAKRPVVCVPCGVRYHYVDDPTPRLLEVMEKLEQQILWRPRPDLPLEQRIYRFAEGMLSLKELEYLERSGSGPLPDRIAHLSDSILRRIEQRYGVDADATTVPERVKTLRQHTIKSLEALPEDDPGRTACIDDLDDLYLVVQLFSYPGDYVAQRPNIERLAETLDKFEEDVLRAPTAGIRSTRRATVTFGEPIDVDDLTAEKKQAVPTLTRMLEDRVQTLLDQTTPTSPVEGD